jgi:hypothetical protein
MTPSKHGNTSRIGSPLAAANESVRYPTYGRYKSKRNVTLYTHRISGHCCAARLSDDNTDMHRRQYTCRWYTTEQVSSTAGTSSQRKTYRPTDGSTCALFIFRRRRFDGVNDRRRTLLSMLIKLRDDRAVHAKAMSAIESTNSPLHRDLLFCRANILIR